MTWEMLWINQGHPRPMRPPPNLNLRKVALAFTEGTAGYRTTGDYIWYLPKSVIDTPGWYRLGKPRHDQVMSNYNKARDEALNRFDSTINDDDIAAVLRDLSWRP